MDRMRLDAARERMQGTAAVALGLALIALLFVYLVPRQAEIAAAMNERWERMRAAAEARDAAPSEATTVAKAPEPDGAAAPEPTAAPAAGTGPRVGTRSDSPPPAPSPAAPPEATSPEVAAALPPEGTAAQLLGRPVVLDTATILIRRGTVHLTGVAAAPLSKKCGDGPSGWFCGVEARTSFRSWLRARSITCDVPKDFGAAAAEVETRCNLAGTDIGGWLVENGYAEAVPDGPYAAAEATAKDARRGIWAERRGAD